MIYVLPLVILLLTLYTKRNSYYVPVFGTAGSSFVPSWKEYICYFADEGEKTEQPTGRKIKETRKKGQVVKSPDLNAAIILLICAMLMTIAGEYSFKEIYRFMYKCFSDYVNYAISLDNIRNLILFYIFEFIKIVGITFAVVMVIGIVANLIQSGFVFSTDPLKPNLKKLNPIEGFKNIFSKRSLFNLLKTLLKFVFIGFVAYTFIRDNIDKILIASAVGVYELFPFVKDVLFQLIIRVLAVMMILGIVDYIYQRYDYKKRLRMTKQEVKEEWKQSEGDPQIRSARRQKQRQLSMNRMMAAVADATVVITNPTHLAIAIRYDTKLDEVPVVVAKGADYVAGKIRERAKEHNVPIIENKPLAQVLYKQVEINEEVPPALYQAVAEILAVVISLNKKAV